MCLAVVGRAGHPPTMREKFAVLVALTVIGGCRASHHAQEPEPSFSTSGPQGNAGPEPLGVPRTESSEASAPPPAPSYPQPANIGQAPREHPVFSRCSSFSFYSNRGTIVYYAPDSTELRRKEGGDSWQGMPTFVITGPTEGVMRGNLGSSVVVVYRSEHSVTFTETTERGNKQIFTVTDEWEGEGFRASYTREGMFGEVRMQAWYSGIAKPLEY